MARWTFGNKENLLKLVSLSLLWYFNIRERLNIFIKYFDVCISHSVQFLAVDEKYEKQKIEWKKKRQYVGIKYNHKKRCSDLINTSQVWPLLLLIGRYSPPIRALHAPFGCWVHFANTQDILLKTRTAKCKFWRNLWSFLNGSGWKEKLHHSGRFHLRKKQAVMEGMTMMGIMANGGWWWWWWWLGWWFS